MKHNAVCSATLALVILSWNSLLCVETVSRQVLLPDGTPVAGAKVRVFARHVWLTNSYENVETNAVTDATGRYTISIEPRAYDDSTTMVDMPGCALMFADVGYEHRSKINAGKPLTLTPAWKIAGRALNASGAALANADVYITSAGGGHERPIFFNSNSGEYAIPELRVQSAADGSFILRGIDFDSQTFKSVAKIECAARAEIDGKTNAGFSNFVFDEYKASAPDKVPALEIVLRPALSIRGRITDVLTGKPLANVHARIYQQSTLPEAISDANGRFEIKVFSHLRHIAMYIEASGFISATAILKPADDSKEISAIEELPVRLHPMVNVSGAVADVDSDALPITQVALGFDCSDKLPGGWNLECKRDWAGGEEGSVKSDGKFSMSVPAGEIQLRVGGPYAWRYKPYDEKIKLNIPAEGLSGLKLQVHRSPGLLVKMTSNFPGEFSWDNPIQHVVTSVQSSFIGSNGFTYADGAPMWFFPVKKWGDPVEVAIERRFTDGRPTEILLKNTSYEANPKTWPVEINLK